MAFTPTRKQLEELAKGDPRMQRALEILFSAPADLTETNLRVTQLESDVNQLEIDLAATNATIATGNQRIKTNEVLMWLST